MRPSRLKPLLWQGVGLLFYFAGMLLFLFVAVDVFLSEPERSLENISGRHMAWILVSVVLIVVGRGISWRMGGQRGMLDDVTGTFGGGNPEQSHLRELGYNVPAETEDDPPYDYEDGDVYVVCSKCGTRNERGYSYCSECSAELPE